MKWRKKNKGFTLIEVCIASAILAIAISPLVANFIQASKMNLRSRKDMNAMNLAHDVLEGVSVHSATDLRKLLATTERNKEVPVDPDDPGAGTKLVPQPSIADILPQTKMYLPDGSVDESSNMFVTSYDEATSGGGQKIDGAGVPIDKVYEYNISKVQTIQNNSINGGEYNGEAHNLYDIKITLDGREKDEEGNVVSGKYASKDYAKITPVDSYYDATYVQAATEIGSITDALSLGQTAPAEAFIGRVVRKMWINIENKGDEANPNYFISVDRWYYVDPAKYDESLGVGCADTHIIGENISKAESYVFPRNIYIYFEGMAGATTHNHYDQIEVRNTTGKSVTVYLIRTIPDELTYSTETLTYNQNYGCTVNVDSLEVDREVDGVTKKDGVTYIVSNLRYDLCAEPENNFRKYKENSTEFAKNVVGSPEEVTANPGMGYKYVGDSRYEASRAKYSYDSTGTGSSLVPMDEDTYSRIVSDGYQEKDDSVVYKVTVEVFEHGKDHVPENRVAIYTGGVVD